MSALMEGMMDDEEIQQIVASARHMLDMIEAQKRHITPAPKHESEDEENSRLERDEVFGDAFTRLEAAISVKE